MKTTLSIKNLMDRDTDRQKAKHRDEGILTGGEQTQKKIISHSGFQQQRKMYKFLIVIKDIKI